ncbi:hypothetical protein H6G52_03675 [Limnothrix sp. FACHB-881]|nr:hypothetical protein [Limnothrix sp. FACHB-881]MBD2634451.1 hypothetical protein [Limnothrix sp. FACHB-881]
MGRWGLPGPIALTIGLTIKLLRGGALGRSRRNRAGSIGGRSPLCKSL